MRAKLEVLAMVLGFIGLFGVITITAIPMWRVSAYIGANLIVVEQLREGLWMTCFEQLNIRMQCKPYESVLILPPELQAARALVCVSIALVFISLVLTGCGTQKSIFCGDNVKGKNITLALAGSLYLLSFVITLIPVSWVAHTVIHNFYNPALLDAQKRELGAAIYIGWATSGVLLVTGIILLYRFSKHKSKEKGPYADTYVMAHRDMPMEDTVDLDKMSSSFHKHQEYV